jgi:hypothetical protein
MPATSKAQQRLMGMAYAFKKGELAQNEVSPDVIQLANSMTMKQLKDFASTKHDGLPDRAEENLSLGNLGGMGANFLPTGTEVGSGDILSGTGSAEEEYKKKKKKRERIMKTKTFEQFISEMNESVLNLPSGMEQFQIDERGEGKQADIYLATFDGSSFKAQSTDKTWDDGVPVTKNFTRGGYKDVKVKGQHYIIEGDTFWYFRIGRTWYAVKRADYGTPPFEY